MRKFEIKSIDVLAVVQLFTIANIWYPVFPNNIRYILNDRLFNCVNEKLLVYKPHILITF